ncbi:S1 RNA-binding domain-containing protein [Deinococcus sedimenti]|uniref:S1 RNA-binding domain-containing protein n=1 Tax=Deinococcus sedimenti TaxID=1867090 RepID=UPI001662B4D8|nr:S1 RNA-binding domain-containing protein [Deinococcus sedimenti]
MVQLDSGAVVEGRVTRVTDFGAFIQFENGETGLVHISQIAHSFVRNIHDHVREGENVEVKVLGRDERGRLDLSIKELLEEPEEVPRPRAIGRQSPQFEAKLRSFMRDAKERTHGGGGGGGGSAAKKPAGKRKR